MRHASAHILALALTCATATCGDGSKQSPGPDTAAETGRTSDTEPEDVGFDSNDSAPGPDSGDLDTGAADAAPDGADDADAGGEECLKPGVGEDAGTFKDPKTLVYRYGPDDTETKEYTFDRRVTASSLQEINSYVNTGDDILIIVEGGHYQFSSGTIEKLKQWNTSQTVGLVAREGADVRWSPPSDKVKDWIWFNTKDVVIDGIDFDYKTPTDAATRVRFTTVSGFTLADTRVIGRAGHSSKRDYPGLVLQIEEKDGIGIVRNYDNPKVSIPQSNTNHDGRYGMYAGYRNFGRIELIDCVVKEANAYGIYASGSNGPVHIRGGIWANNFGFNIRVPNGGTVEDAYIYHDWSRYTGPADRMSDGNAVATGILAETKALELVDGRTGLEGEPITIRNTRIELGGWPKGYRAGILVNSNHGELRVVDSEIVVESDAPRAGIWAAPPDGSTIWTDPSNDNPNHHMPKGSVRTYVEDTQITGDADIPAIKSEERENSEVTNSIVSGYTTGIWSTEKVLEASRTEISADTPTKGEVDWVSKKTSGEVGSNLCP